MAKVVNRTPDPIWPAPDAPEVKKARTKPKPQPQQQAADEGATSSKAAAKGKGGSKKGKR